MEFGGVKNQRSEKTIANIPPMELTMRSKSIGLRILLILLFIDCLEEARYTRNALDTTNKVVEAMSIAWTNPEGSAISFIVLANP
ncbi:unnamed protein product [marine sediment metagenome]|uniref:Uncharacterized protein n=1 Tax=marine sediment metagenome TaxID=412755 RepID=X1U436_9ZZZZ